MLGGSFALDLKACGLPGRVLGVSRDPKTYPEPVAAAIRPASLEQALAEADVILLCGPVLASLARIEAIGPLARPGTLITDIGSTKRAVMEAASRHVAGAGFLGGHPMAGKQYPGIEHAETGLFRGRTWFLVEGTPNPPHRAAFVELLDRIGAVVRWIDAETHDRSVAYTSHLPQILSSALAASLNGAIPPAAAAERCGQGLRDMLRISESDWGMWRDILATNADFIAEAVEIFSARLKQIAPERHIGQRVVPEDLTSAEAIFGEGRAFTSALPPRK